MANLVKVQEGAFRERTSKEKVGSLVGGGVNVAAFAAAIAWLLGAFGVDVSGGETHIMALIVAGIAFAGAVKSAVTWWGRERANREAMKQAATDGRVQREIQDLQDAATASKPGA